MNFSVLINTLRAQECGINSEQLEQQMKEEKEKIESSIRKAFEDKTYEFVWENGMSWSAMKALEDAGCSFRSFLKPCPSMDFGGWVIQVFPQYPRIKGQ